MLPGDLFVYLYRSSARNLSGAEANLAEYLAEQLAFRTGARASRGEMKSWRRSIPVLRDDLLDAGLGDVEVLLEYQLPLTSKRADVVLAGRHPQTGVPSYVVLELKQWSDAEQFEDSDTLVHIAAYGHHAVLHPGLQVDGYCTHITDFTSALSANPHELGGATYLHNATDHGVEDLFLRPQTDTSRVFTGQRRAEFHDYLRSRLAPGESGTEPRISSSRARRSPRASCWTWRPTRCSDGNSSSCWMSSALPTNTSFTRLNGPVTQPPRLPSSLPVGPAVESPSSRCR